MFTFQFHFYDIVHSYDRSGEERFLFFWDRECKGYPFLIHLYLIRPSRRTCHERFDINPSTTEMNHLPLLNHSSSLSSFLFFFPHPFNLVTVIIVHRNPSNLFLFFLPIIRYKHNERVRVKRDRSMSIQWDQVWLASAYDTVFILICALMAVDITVWWYGGYLLTNQSSVSFEIISRLAPNLNLVCYIYIF